MYTNMKIFILGMARSGYEAAKILAERNNKIVINDFNVNQNPEHVKELEDLGVKVVLGSHPDDLLDETFDLLIKNPGIHFDHKYVIFCEKHNIKLVNEIEMAYHLLPKGVKIIGITGTNGKTTTTTLTHLMLKSFFKNKVHLAGNIGYPLCEVLPSVKENDYIVMEIGVPQLHDFYDFKPDIAVLTNIFEAHLDMFGTRDYYNENKLRIFMNHTKDDVAIINYSNQDAYCITKNIISTKKYFCSQKEIEGCYIKNNIIYYYHEPIIKLDNIKLVGIHNYENAMCAIMIAKELNIPNINIVNVLETFCGVEHRIEFVKIVDGVKYFNDSKSTNIKSTQIALNSFNRPTILLLGGLDRGHSFYDLKEYLNNTKLIIGYGECKDRIKTTMDDLKINCLITDDLEKAVKLAQENALEDEIILLSPASASWDQYESYEKRGEHFKRIVHDL